jgi:hypothetical protein
MKKTLAITALVATAIALGAVALLVALGELGELEDPAVAPCRQPPTALSRSHVVLDHRELGVRFTCNGARLAGTLFLPLGRGSHPAVVWLHGSGDQPRLSYGPLVASFVQDGIAFFSYDKRGVGESEGHCCPDVRGRFNLVTSDAVGAVAAVRASAAVDGARVGFLGASAAGWVAPRATQQSGHVRFSRLRAQASSGTASWRGSSRKRATATGAPRRSRGRSRRGRGPASTRSRPSSGSASRRSGSSAGPTATSPLGQAPTRCGGSKSDAARIGRSSSSQAQATAFSTILRPIHAPRRSPKPGSGARSASDSDRTNAVTAGQVCEVPLAQDVHAK